MDMNNTFGPDHLLFICDVDVDKNEPLACWGGEGLDINRGQWPYCHPCQNLLESCNKNSASYYYPAR